MCVRVCKGVIGACLDESFSSSYISNTKACTHTQRRRDGGCCTLSSTFSSLKVVTRPVTMVTKLWDPWPIDCWQQIGGKTRVLLLFDPYKENSNMIGRRLPSNRESERQKEGGNWCSNAESATKAISRVNNRPCKQMRHAEIKKKKKTCLTRSQPQTANPDLMHTYLRSYTREREREGEGERGGVNARKTISKQNNFIITRNMIAFFFKWETFFLFWPLWISYMSSLRKVKPRPLDPETPSSTRLCVSHNHVTCHTATLPCSDLTLILRLVSSKFCQQNWSYTVC